MRIATDNLAQAITLLRVKRKKSQADLASAARCSAGHISRIEAGATTPSYDLLHRIADALNATITLVERTKENENQD